MIRRLLLRPSVRRRARDRANTDELARDSGVADDHHGYFVPPEQRAERRLVLPGDGAPFPDRPPVRLRGGRPRVGGEDRERRPGSHRRLRLLANRDEPRPASPAEQALEPPVTALDDLRA